ncbi:MAG: histidine phosphatase family protein [Ruminococcus sp.]|uniref:histidine phosphatase family protein n=1 Tax=Ruminococcus sp. TaxID=41978 RepID=UPI002873A622|nr:histidine phosphatase family protein [Ruminococcus sp.]MBQ3284006.1 histidine phosphatase family protein [Ruminococcus sp.]
MKSYYLHFIRHGAISPTLAGRYIGVTDVPLSDQGKKDIERMAATMDYPYAKVVFTSPLKRCTQTARRIYHDIEPLVVDQLSECHFGEWENKTADELKGDEAFSKWLSGDMNAKPPRGESTADFTRRICVMFESIVDGLMKTGTTDAAFIMHGGVMNTLLAVYGLPQANPFDWACDNGYGYSLRITPSLWMRDKVAEVFDRIPKTRDSEDE